MVDNVKLTGFKEFEAKLRAAQRNIGLVGIATLQDVMKLGYDIAYRECPEGETGNLKASISYNIQKESSGKDVGELRVDSPYALYVDKGTSTMEARPFFTNAVIAMRLAVIKMTQANLKKAMAGQEITVSGVSGKGAQIRTPRKYLYQTRSRSGRTRYVYSRQRAGTVKFRGKFYTGRNYAAMFESA